MDTYYKGTIVCFSNWVLSFFFSLREWLFAAQREAIWNKSYEWRAQRGKKTARKNYGNAILGIMFAILSETGEKTTDIWLSQGAIVFPSCEKIFVGISNLATSGIFDWCAPCKIVLKLYFNWTYRTYTMVVSIFVFGALKRNFWPIISSSVSCL